jgi:hypothetical protein
LVFSAADWAVLSTLPRLGLSFGPVEPPLACITAVRLSIFMALTFAMRSWQVLQKANILRKVNRTPTTVTETQPHLNVFRLAPWLTGLLLLNLGVLVCEIYGLYIEPFDLRTSKVKLTSPDLKSGQAIRIVHLSDIHVERITRRELEMIETVQALNPDLILLTGDYPNIDYKYDPATWQDTRTVLSQLSAPYGVYAAPGNLAVDPSVALEAIFGGLENVVLLQDETRRVEIKGNSISIIGISMLDRGRDADILNQLMGQIPQHTFSLLLYHSPALADAAARDQVDLYLAGHTHGGQVCLPFWGAIITASYYGKQYESGLYNLDPTWLYVSRGVGMEGMKMPRVRFLSPPEIVVIDLYGTMQP